MQKPVLIGLITALILLTNLSLHQAIPLLLAPASRNNHPALPKGNSSHQGRLETQYQVHAPIFILNNTDFASQATIEGWPGTGTKTDPYIIEGLNISDYNDDLIKIVGTNVYFIITNCVLANGTIGIYFEYVSNAQIINNSLSNNDYGIFLQHSVNNTFTNNTLSKNHQIGRQKYQVINKLLESMRITDLRWICVDH